jgi:hypothetical protein
LWEFIEATDGCNGYIYKRQFTNEVRAAHASPVSAGKKKAQGVFLRIGKQKNAIWVRRALPYSSKDKAIGELEILIDHASTDWSQFEKMDVSGKLLKKRGATSALWGNPHHMCAASKNESRSHLNESPKRQNESRLTDSL